MLGSSLSMALKKCLMEQFNAAKKRGLSSLSPILWRLYWKKFQNFRNFPMMWEVEINMSNTSGQLVENLTFH